MSIVKIAFGTDADGVTLSNRFGQASQVVVVTVEDGREVAREVRPKAHHDHDHHHHDHEGDCHGHGCDEHEHVHGHGHGGGPAVHFGPIQDCQVVVTRSIGPGGQAYAQSRGIQLYAVSDRTVDEALSKYLAGTLQHNPRRIA